MQNNHWKDYLLYLRVEFNFGGHDVLGHGNWYHVSLVQLHRDKLFHIFIVNGLEKLWEINGANLPQSDKHIQKLVDLCISYYPLEQPGQCQWNAWSSKSNAHRSWIWWSTSWKSQDGSSNWVRYLLWVCLYKSVMAVTCRDTVLPDDGSVV